MFNIIFRVLVIYLVVIGVMRLMGKRQIGELEPFELVITLIIADLATIPMAEQSIPIWYGVIPLLVLCVIHFITSLLSKHSPLVRDIMSGKPVIVIDDNGIVFKELKKLNISCEELMEALRNLNYFDLSEVNYAIIERNGKITVIPKAENMPVTREDITKIEIFDMSGRKTAMKISVPDNDVMYAVIENGKAIKKNFKEMGIQHIGGTSRILHKMGCSMRDIAFATLSESGNVSAQTFGGIPQSFQIKTSDIFTKVKQNEDKQARQKHEENENAKDLRQKREKDGGEQ